jgi:hypothetical protein
MKVVMDLPGAISLIALLVSVGSLFWSFSCSNRTLRLSLLGKTEAAYIPIEHLLATAPGALKFHGIEPDDLQNMASRLPSSHICCPTSPRAASSTERVA